ncbi:MAG: hypothetical protein DWI29_03285 [Planctomycetota bacterium]|nr:MAG: hypothetical protein DWI29_03285 [Planctomycetota bacterium]
MRSSGVFLLGPLARNRYNRRISGSRFKPIVEIRPSKRACSKTLRIRIPGDPAQIDTTGISGFSRLRSAITHAMPAESQGFLPIRPILLSKMQPAVSARTSRKSKEALSDL